MPRRNTKRKPRNRKRKITKYRKNNLALKVYTFSEYLKNKTIDLNSTQLDAQGHLTITQGQSFNFNQLPQAAHYSNLFEQYRILKIIAEFSWGGVGNSPPLALTGLGTVAQPYINQMLPGNNAPTLLLNRNHNSINLTYPAMDTSQRTKRIRLKTGQIKYVSLVPSCQDVMQAVGTNTINIPKYKQWFLSDPVSGAQDVPHFGFNYQVDTYNAGNSINMGTILIKYKMIFQCKYNE